MTLPAHSPSVAESLEPRTLFSLPGHTLPNITDTATDAAGNVYRAGTFTGTVDFNPSPAATTNLTAQSTDAYVAKFAHNGTLLWAHHWGTPQPIARPRIGVTPSGDIYLAADYTPGINVGPDPTTSIVSAPAASANRGIVVFRLDYSGAYVRSNTFATPGQDLLPVDVAPTPDGHVALVANGFVPGIPDSDDYKGDANFYLLTARLRTAVHHRWAEILTSTPGVVEARSVAVAPSGAVYIAGATAPDVDFAPGPRVRKVPGSLTDSPFLLRLAPTGRFDWVIGYQTARPATLWIDNIDADDSIHVSGDYVPTLVDFNPSPRKQFILTTPTGGDDPSSTYTALFSPRGALLSAQDTSLA